MAARMGDVGFRVIGVFKVLGASLLAAAGLGAFRLMGRDLGEWAEQLVQRLHLDPENRLIRAAVAGVSGVEPDKLRLIGIGTVVYAALYLVEGVGLLLRRRWAGYLVIVITASLLPIELVELARKVTVVRGLVLGVNLAILAYLVVELVRERRADRDGALPSGSAAPTNPL